jgi:steroid delta-isomerase-like uncharacterized protein
MEKVRSRNAEAVEAIQEAFNARDFDAILETLDEHCIWTDHARGIQLKTREEFRGWLQGWVDGFSDARVTDHRVTDAGGAVVSQFVGCGVNDGSLGGLPVTGREVGFPVCEIFHFSADGKVIAGETYYDQATMLSQLGLLPAPGA